jgi:hypothetical protein
MPAQITHILAGDAALSRADPGLFQSLTEEALKWFHLGCQGPDIFYHNQRTRPSGLHYGALAHRRDYGHIVEGALRSRPDWAARRPGAPGGPLPPAVPPAVPPALAWLLGFATHAAVDRALHPYIVYFSGWVDPSLPLTQKNRSCHPFFERILDLVYLARARGEAGADFDIEAWLPLEGRSEDGGERQGIEEEVVAALALGLRRGFPRATAADFLLDKRIGNALSDSRYLFRATNPAKTGGGPREGLSHFDDRLGPRSLSIVYPIALPLGYDFANEAGRLWSHPAGDGRESRAGLFELLDEGIAAAARALGLLLDPERSLAAGEGRLAEEIGLGGLSITDREGKTTRPLLSDPLPLPELMAAEFQTRLEQAKHWIH